MSKLRAIVEQWPITVLVTLWVVGSVGGMAVLWSHSTGPGTPASAPYQLAEAVGPVAPTPGSNNLYLFLHPKCPCSQATVNMAARFLAQAKTRPVLRIFVALPAGKDDSWAQESLWKSAEQLAPEAMHLDRGGKIAVAMGVKTSGQVLLYDGEGQLRYAGGITAGRGHEGMNPGFESALAALEGERATEAHTAAADRKPAQHPVYGCALEFEGGGP